MSAQANPGPDPQDVVHLQLTAQHASLLLDILWTLETAIWDVHGDYLAAQAQAASAQNAHDDALAETAADREVHSTDDLPPL